MVDDIGHNGDKQTEQHDCSAGVYHWMQEIPRVWWEGQHSLQILQVDTSLQKEQWRIVHRIIAYNDWLEPQELMIIK